MVGDVVGLALGPTVGEAVGDALVGLELGTALGDAVGFAVGVALGNADVGAKVSPGLVGAMVEGLTRQCLYSALQSRQVFLQARFLQSTCKPFSCRPRLGCACGAASAP